MIKTSTIIFLCLGLFGVSGASTFDPETSIVEIEVTKETYDYTEPWATRSKQIRKNGILIGEYQILTTADGLSGQYLCRIKKGGSSKQYTASLKWVDYYANVAIFDVPDPTFRKGMQPVALTDTIPESGELQIYRWRAGRMEKRSAEIIRLYSGSSKMSYLEHLELSVASTIEAAGHSEIAFDDNQLTGLTTAASKGKLTILPAQFIAGVIKSHTLEDSGLGYFDFKYMYAKNPALLASKGLNLRDLGVIVTEVGSKGLAKNTLKQGDVILAIDGFEIDSEGKYIDPQYGRLSMGSLATRKHMAGESIQIRLWRNNREETVDYILPQASFEKSLIPEHRYDASPQYLIAGGIVFQPLNGPLIRALNGHHQFLFDYYNNRPPLEGHDGIVVIGAVLPDSYNEGCQSFIHLIIDQINGQKIYDLEDVKAALEAPKDGFHWIQLKPDEQIKHFVLDAKKMPGATARILKHYRIAREYSI